MTWCSNTIMTAPNGTPGCTNKAIPQTCATGKPCIPTASRPKDGGDHLPLHFPAQYRAEHSEARFVTESTIDYLRAREGESWCFSLNYIKPHGPYICPEPFHAMYAPGQMPEPVRREEERANRHPYMSRCRSDWGQTELAVESEWRELRACYYGMVTELDQCLGILFDYLRRSGQWDTTLILFSSDHGSYLGDHYLSGKPHFYDAAIRVPMIIRDPSPEADFTRGTQMDGFVEGVDIAPTICQYLGVPRHPRFQGKSMLECLRSEPGACAQERNVYEFYYYNLLRDTTESAPRRAGCGSCAIMSTSMSSSANRRCRPNCSTCSWIRESSTTWPYGPNMRPWSPNTARDSSAGASATKTTAWSNGHASSARTNHGEDSAATKNCKGK